MRNLINGFTFRVTNGLGLHSPRPKRHAENLQDRPTGKCSFAQWPTRQRARVAELESFIRAEGNGRRIVIDLKDLTLAGEDGIALPRSV